MHYVSVVVNVIFIGLQAIITKWKKNLTHSVIRTNNNPFRNGRANHWTTRSDSNDNYKNLPDFTCDIYTYTKW